MWERLKDIWTQLVWGDRFMAVHVHISDAGAYTITALTVTRKKEEIEITAQIGPDPSLHVLKDVSAMDIPTTVILTGKGIISKRIPRNVGSEEVQISEQLAAYGNTNVSHTVTENDNWLYVHVIRTDLLNTWLSRLEEAVIYPLHLCLGASSIWEVLPYLSDTTEVSTGHYRYVFDDHGLDSIQDSDAPSGQYILGGDKVSGSILLPYAGIISLFKEAAQTPTSVQGALESQWKEAYYQRATKQAGLIGIAAIFLILLVNTGLFMHLYGKRTDLEAELFTYQGKLSEVALLQQELKRKNEMVQASGTHTHGRFAYHADQVASVLTPDIHLTRLTVNPIQPLEARSDRVTVKTDVLEVEGNCRESSELDRWVTRLDTLDVVQGVHIQGFGKKRGSEDNVFTLNITMKNR